MTVLITQHSIRDLCRVEQALAQPVIGRVVAVFGKPAFHIRETGYWRNFDTLLGTE